MKRAFSLFTVLIFVMVMSIVGYLIVSTNSMTTKNITHNFLSTRADLMVRASTEYAILALDGYDFSNGCLKGVNLEDNLFDVNITYTYFLTSCAGVDCRCKEISTADTNGSVLIYVIVKSKNPNFHIRKAKFTLQNP